MDLVGFAPVSRWDHAPFLLSPKAILPDSKTVIVAAIHITDTWTEMGGEPEPQDRSPGGWMDQNSLLDRVAYRTVRLLNDNGRKGIAVASSNIWRYRRFEGIPSLFAPDLSHIHAAAAAGLAEIGWSGLAITPEFGARCRFISIVTDAYLVPTPMYSGPKLCDMCGECIKHCPTEALRKELGKAHEVRIGEKTYRYANKNIWRCAWAEHFDLDLNSQHLKEWNTIGEKEILAEIAEKGKRGHERGVCQKYCVPPHLRTTMPSFGRDHKQIAQNRINKRYPDSMPTLRKLRDDLSATAIRMGADLCSVTSLKQDIGTAPGYTILRENPTVTTIIALGLKTPESSAAGRTLMHHICLKLARMVEDCGYSATSYTGMNELGEMAGICSRQGGSQKHSSPELGPNFVIGAIATNAPLDPSPTHTSITVSVEKRKPDPRALRRQLEALADANQASLFGVAPARRFDRTVSDLRKAFADVDLGIEVVDENLQYHGAWKSGIRNDQTSIKHPGEHLPGARSVIVLGMHFPREIIENAGKAETQQIGPYAFWQYQTRNELNFASFHLAKHLESLGYKTIISDNLLGIGSKVDSHRGLLPDARCNAIEGVAAGLGRIGKNGDIVKCCV